MQHGMISLSIHRMTVSVNESTKTLNGNNSLCLSWKDILMNGLHLNLLGHNTNPHTICKSIIFMTLSFHFGNHGCIFVLVSTCVTEWVMHIKEGNKNWLEQRKQKHLCTCLME